MRPPADACDAHVHILDPRFPALGSHRPAAMAFEDCAAEQRRLGMSRTVIVQPKFHGTDHTCLLDALRRFEGTARGVGVVLPDVSDAELRRLDEAGVRGLRFSLWNPADAIATVDMIEPLSRRIADLGWHAQINMHGEQIVEAAALFDRLPCPVVFDHMGRPPPVEGPSHPSFGVIVRLVDKDKAWVKLSGAHHNTGEGPPDYADAARLTHAFAKAAPDRLVWGSDWPYLTEVDKPDGAMLLDSLAAWIDDEGTLAKILVANPARLYRFG